jgi:hypothetical protein
MAGVNRIFVDSRHRQADSRSTTDFRVELPETITVDDNMCCVVTDVCIPVSWYTVETDVNDKLFVRVITTATNFADYIITFASRNYTRTELVDAINYEFAQRSLPLECDEDPFRNIIRIVATAISNKQFMVFSNADLQTNFLRETWKGTYYSRSNPQSINDVIGNTDFKLKVYDSVNIYEGGQFNAVPHHTVYIVCPQLGTYKSIGPQGERDILKKHVVMANPHEISFDTALNAEDFSNISKLSFKSLQFRLLDVYGNVLNMHGQNWSFTLIIKPIY